MITWIASVAGKVGSESSFDFHAN